MDQDSPLDDKTTARWALQLFGGFELTELAAGKRLIALGKRERVLLAYLAVAPNCRENRRKLATLLWGDASDETALDNLRTCVWGLRKALGDTAHRIVASEGESVVLDSSVFEIDALNFRRLAARTDAAELDAAVKSYAGEFLHGLDIENEEFESWRRSTANLFRDSAVDASGRLLNRLVETGDTEGAIKSGLRLLQVDPLNEAAARHLMRLYARSGRRSAAIQMYRTLAESLKTELDAQPEAETRTIYAEIVRGDERPPETAVRPQPPATARPVHRVPQPENPLRFPLPALVAALAVMALLVFSYRELPLFRGADTIVTERAAAASQASAISIAVLPFVNLSDDRQQDFFSDGMTEEITTALAKVPDLRVVARLSAFQFKGENKDARAVGRALGATHLLEGTVRRDGDRVRISAELVQAGNGITSWSANYDRQLTDIFAIQEDIATAIAGALRMPLGLKPGEQLVANRAIDQVSYVDYLRAKALIRSRIRDTGLKSLADAAVLLEQVVARNPAYAPGWAQLAYDYAYTPGFHPSYISGSVDDARNVVMASLAKSEAAAQRAIELDPNLADGYLARGLGQSVQGRYLEAEDYYRKAIALDAGNTDALNSYSFMLAGLGHLKQSLPMREQLQSLDPFVPNFINGSAYVFWLSGQTNRAVGLARTLPNVPQSARILAQIYAAEGHYSEAADTLEHGAPANLNLQTQDQAAVRMLRMAATHGALVKDVPRLGINSFAYVAAGADDHVLDFSERNAQAGYSLGANTSLLWQPAYAAARKTERFKNLVRKMGLVEYWRARGWPDLCHPASADDFECR